MQGPGALSSVGFSFPRTDIQQRCRSSPLPHSPATNHDHHHRPHPQAFESGPPSVRGLALLALSAAGRGGEGDMGQRIRDEILAIQHRSGAKVRAARGWVVRVRPFDHGVCRVPPDDWSAGSWLSWGRFLLALVHVLAPVLCFRRAA